MGNRLNQSAHLRRATILLVLAMNHAVRIAFAAESAVEDEVVPGVVHVFKGHGTLVPSVAFLPDGKQLMSCSYDGTRLWNLDSGETGLSIKPGGLAALSLDGSVMAIRWGNAIRVYSTADGKVAFDLDPQPDDTTSSIEFSPKGDFLAVAGPKGLLRIYDARTGKLKHLLAEHTKAINSVAFHPTEPAIISGGSDGKIIVWDYDTGKRLRQFAEVKARVRSLAFSPDARHVLVGSSDSDVMVWHYRDGILLRRLPGHIADVSRAVFAPDGIHVVSGSADRTVRVWNIQTGRQLAVFEGHQEQVLDIDISPDGKFAASAAGGRMENGKWVAGSEFGVRVWRLPINNSENPDRLQLTKLEEGPAGEYASLKGIKSDVLALDLSADGRLVATGERDGTAQVWDTDTMRPVARMSPHEDMVRAVAISPDGKRLVTGTHGRALRLWDIETRNELLSCPVKQIPSQVLNATFLPDGRRVVFGTNRSTLIWDTETNTATALTSGWIHPHCLAVSPDGSIIAAATNESLVRFWDAATGKPLRDLKGHTDEVQGLEFSPDGNQLVSCSRDATVKLWDTTTGELLRTFHGHEKWVYGASFLPDGRRVISSGDAHDGTIRLWDSATGRQLWQHSNGSRHSRIIKTTPDSRFAIVANSKAVDFLRLPPLQNTTALDAYELARSHEGADSRIAVLEFIDKGPSLQIAQLRNAVAELLTARLAQHGGLRVVERLQVKEFFKETSLADTSLIDKQTAQKAGKTLNANYLLSGSYTGRDETITIEAALTRVGDEKPLAQWTVDGTVSDIFKIEEQLRTRIVETLGIDPEDVDTFETDNSTQSTAAVLAFRNVGRMTGVAAEATADGSKQNPLTDETLKDLQIAIGELLQTSMSTLPDVKLVDRVELEKIVAEQKLTLAGLTSATTASQVGRLLGAERLIYGSFVESGGRLAVIARVADTETASIVAHAVIDGPTSELDTMLTALAERLAPRLSAAPESESATLRWRATEARREEAAEYQHRAIDYIRKGNHKAAFDEFDRAVLITPDDLNLRLTYIRSMKEYPDPERLTRVCESTLALESTLKRYYFRREVYQTYIAGLGKFREQRAEVSERYSREFSPRRYSATARRNASSRASQIRKKDRDGAIRLLENSVKQARGNGTQDDQILTLLDMYNFFAGEVSYGVRTTEVTKDSANRAAEVAEQILNLVVGRQNQVAQTVAKALAPDAANVRYYKDGKRYIYLDLDRRIEILEQMNETLSWHRPSRESVSRALGEAYDSRGDFAKSVDAFREELAADAFSSSALFSDFNVSFRKTDWLNNRLTRRFALASRIDEKFDDPAQAVEEYNGMIGDFGLVHEYGPAITRRLDRLKKPAEIPPGSVLVCGGSVEGLRSWRQVPGLKDRMVHMARRHHLSASDLAPYDLVLLTRAHDLTYDPVDIFALRSYVATGGSLLMVLTPYWEPGAPVIHNPLLQFFDIKAGVDDIVHAPVTKRNPEHPITRGIPAAAAMHAVELECSEAMSLMESDGRTILAATQYRKGKVVVSSFGQWLMPDPTVFGNRWNDYIRKTYPGSLTGPPPVEAPTSTNAKLLAQTLAWLSKRDTAGAEPDESRARLRTVLTDVRRFENTASDLDQVVDAFEDLIDNADGEAKEDALWLAGESFLRLYHQHARSSSVAFFSNDQKTEVPGIKYYERLIQQFPDSALRPFAEWRRAECIRRASLGHERLIAEYSKINAPKGSPTWAWTQSRVGSLHWKQGDIEKAAARYQGITDGLVSDPEKVRAMISLSKCYRKLGNNERAKALLEAAHAHPNVEWDDSTSEHFHPLECYWGSSIAIIEWHMRSWKLKSL
jgi:WD40 repeat protein/tetratricopeptide (TPR) repeat protein